jgi:hypothetical protein
LISGLENKEINYETYANNLIENKDQISEYLDGLTSKNQIYMENCFYVLRVISEKKPDFLHPHWDFFVKYMQSSNHYHKTAAVILISNLTAFDPENKFEDIFDEFFNNLKSEKTMMPMYLLKNSSKIINNKPNLEEKITDIFLDIDNIHPGKQIELVKSAVIESFSEYFDKTSKKNEILGFVKKQLNSSSPKTKKTAKEFLEKWGES